MAFLHIARGSLSEVETQLRLAQRVGYLSSDNLTNAENLCVQVGRLLNAVIRGLRRRSNATV